MPRLLALLALCTAAPALAQSPETASNRPEDGAFISQVTFTCERGAQVPVAYVNTPEGKSFAVAQIEGQQIAMIQTVSGSGIRYRSVDPDRPYALHAKGEDGVFLYGAEADADTILAGCKAR